MATVQIGPPAGGILSVKIDQSGAGTDELVTAPGENLRVKVVSYVVVQSGAGTTKFTDGTDDLSGAMSFAANGGAVASSVHAMIVAGANRPLNIVSTGAAAKGHLSYYIER